LSGWFSGWPVGQEEAALILSHLQEATTTSVAGHYSLASNAHLVDYFKTQASNRRRQMAGIRAKVHRTTVAASSPGRKSAKSARDKQPLQQQQQQKSECRNPGNPTAAAAAGFGSGTADDMAGGFGEFRPAGISSHHPEGYYGSDLSMAL
jgi:hypothetical protein